jgi:hypothetical protein
MKFGEQLKENKYMREGGYRIVTTSLLLRSQLSKAWKKLLVECSSIKPLGQLDALTFPQV